MLRGSLRSHLRFIVQNLLLGGIIFALTTQPVVGATLEDAYSKRDYYSKLAEQARKQISQKQKDAAAVREQIDVVAVRIADAESALTETERQILSTENAIKKLEEEIQVKEDDLAREKAKQDSVISSWYMDGEERLLTTLIGSETLSDVVTKYEQYNSIRQQIEVAMERIDELRIQLEIAKNDKDHEREKLQDAHKNQQSQKANLEYQKEMKNRLLNDTQKAIVQLKEEEKRATQKEQQALQEISSLIMSRRNTWIAQKGKGQRVNAGDVIGTMGSTGNSTGAHLHFEVRTADGTVVNPRSYLGSTFIWPTPSRRVTQEYGWTDYARAGAYGGSPHSGIDVGAVTPGVWGDPILAAGPGEIVFKDWRGAYGYAVVILHDNNMITLYAHLGTAN